MFETKMFALARKTSPSPKRLKLCTAKEENVVKPPKNPTSTADRTAGSIRYFSSVAWNRNPIARQPDRFTIKVPKGNEPPHHRSPHPDNQYRASVPSKPAIPIKDILYMKFCSEL